MTKAWNSESIAFFHSGLDNASDTIDGSSFFSHINDMLGKCLGLKMPLLARVIIGWVDKSGQVEGGSSGISGWIGEDEIGWVIGWESGKSDCGWGDIGCVPSDNAGDNAILEEIELVVTGLSKNGRDKEFSLLSLKDCKDSVVLNEWEDKICDKWLLRNWSLTRIAWKLEETKEFELGECWNKEM